MSKSTTCLGKNGPLTEYDSEWEAQDTAEHVEREHGRSMEPYQCDTCNKWHLSPKDRQTPSVTCTYCKDSSGGKPKQAYKDEESARKRADIICEEREVSLRAYKCEYGMGWHLTSRSDAY